MANNDDSTVLTQEYVFAALEAERQGNQFPVDFDGIWECSGYTERKNALRRLLNSRLKEGVDFYSLKSERSKRDGGFTKYFLIVDATKSFLLSANTDEGEETRRYFISVEKKYREQLERSFASVGIGNELSQRDTQITELTAKIAELEKTIAALSAELNKAAQNHQEFSYSV